MIRPGNTRSARWRAGTRANKRYRSGLSLTSQAPDAQPEHDAGQQRLEAPRANSGAVLTESSDELKTHETHPNRNLRASALSHGSQHGAPSTSVPAEPVPERVP